MCLELRRLSLQTRRVAVKIRYVDYQLPSGYQAPLGNQSKFADCAATLSSCSDSEPDIFPTVEKLFSEIYTRKVGIRHLGITAVRLIPAMRQFGFFDQEKDKHSNLSKGLDKVRRHFGYHAIFYGKTMPIGSKFREVVDGYELRTPSLSL